MYKFQHPVWLIILFLVACDDKPQLPPLSDDGVILAFGDSITHGYGVKNSESYPAILEKLTGRTVINAGVTGEESVQGLERLPEELENYQPDLMILCHGGNDILRKRDIQIMEANIREMIKLAKERNISVILLGVPKPGIFLSSLPVYREIAETTGVFFIEKLLPEVLGDKKLKSDTVHPNKEGYRKIAEKIYSFLLDSGAV
jgi:acyl-CoA thioesterase I